MFVQLSKTVLFASLSPEEIEALLLEVGFKVKNVASGDVVGLAGDTLSGISILIKGSVRAEMLDFSGRAITIENLQAPNLLAPAFLFGKKGKLPVDIIARDDVELLFVNKTSFLKLMQLHTMVLSNFLDVVSGKTQFLAEKINFLSFKTIREKYIHFTLSHYKRTGQRKFALMQTQVQLAEFFGVSRPALAKVIAELNEEGMIKTKGKQVEIINIPEH